MKKYSILLAAVAVFAAASCAKEAPAPEEIAPAGEQTQTTEEQTLTNPITITFSANAETKVSLVGEGTSGARTAVWDEGDQIKIIWYNTDEGEMKSATTTVDSFGTASTTFTATVEEADYYYAVYPASIEATLDDEENFTVNFPDNRTLTNSFADAAWYASKTTKSDKSFAFHPVSTIIKFNVDGSKSGSPTHVYFRGMSGGGIYRGITPITFANEDGYPITVGTPTGDDAKANVTALINGPGTYYLSLPASGQTTSNGFILQLKKSGVKTPAAYYSANIVQTPGKFYNITSSVDNKIIKDFYVAPESSSEAGDPALEGYGTSSSNPATYTWLQDNIAAFKFYDTMSAAFILNGTTIHLMGSATSYDTPLSTMFPTANRDYYSYTIQGGEGEGKTTFTTSATSSFSNAKATVLIKDLTFSGCTTEPAVKVSAGKVSFDNIHLTACSAKGFDLTGGTTVITSSSIHDFNADNNALVISGTAVVTISETSFTNNSCTGQNGGPIRVAAGSVTIKDCSFESNSCKNSSPNYGGAIAVAAGDVSLENCTFTENKAQAAKGGAIGLGTAANLEVKDCKFIGNTCTGNSGGGVFIGNTYTGHAYFTGCIFTGNTTGSQYGAALHAANQAAANTSFLGINNCLFINNGGTNANNANINPMIPHVIMNSTIISQSSYCGGLTVRGGANANNGKYGGSLLLNNIISNEGDSKPALSTVNTSYWLRCNGYNYYSSALATGQQTFSANDVVSQLTEGPSASSTNYTWNASTYAWTWAPSDAQKESMASYTTLRGLVSNDRYDDNDSYVHDNALAFLAWLESLEYEYSSTKYNAFRVDINGRPRNTSAYWPGCYQND